MGKIDFRGRWLLSAILCIGFSSVFAAPFNGQILELKQPDGTVIEVKGYGDEFYGRFESLDGYTLVRDCATGWMVYADTNEDASEFIPTEVAYDHRVPTNPEHPSFIARTQAKQKSLSKQTPGRGSMNRGLQKHIDLRADIIRSKKQKGKLELEPVFEADQDITAASFETLAPDTIQPITGNIIGLTILVDFSDDIGNDVSASQVEAFCNQAGYTGNGNNGSVRDYFYDVSGGALNYTNLVTEYIRMPHTKAYYEDGCDNYGKTWELVTDAIEGAIDQGYNFSSLTREGSNNRVKCLNIFYAGGTNCGWAKGLWPHRSSIGNWRASDGTVFHDYQMTYIGSSLTIRTFCHENGHMMCDYPDLYDYGYESSGIGNYGLMAGGGSNTNPTPPNPYFRDLQGWETIIDITDSFGNGFSHSSNSLTTYRYSHPTNSQEFFLIESIVKTGRLTYMPDDGLLIWHVDEAGSNNNEQMTPSQHYKVSVEQADGAFHLENGNNSGGGGDLFHAGYVDRFDDTTLPNANWWDGSDSGMLIQAISERGNPMTFVLGELGDFQVTPYTNFESSGIEDGLLNPSGKNYLLKNTGAVALNWTATKSADWYDISQTDGTLAAGASETLSVTLNANANLLSTGIHTDTIFLTDLTNNIITERLVRLEIKSRQLVGYWKLDETSGATANDSTPNANHGSLRGDNTFDTSSVPGQFGGGLTLDGGDDYIEIPALDLYSNTVTMTAWVKWNGTQTDWAGIVFSRSGASVAGLSMKSSGEIRYHWNDTASSYNWSTGLIVPTNKWVFTALVVEPTKATMYMYDGSLHSSSQTVNHDIEEFNGLIRIGYDTSSRYFKGDIDDVRIYNTALSGAQIRDVISGGPAASPLPQNRSGNVSTMTTLQWAMGASAVNNDVYFGTDYNAVANAGIASVQYKGRQTETSYVLPILQSNTEYFWRVDQVASDGAIIAGPVWRFTTGGNLGGITREVWQNIGSGNTITDLTGQANYPDNPDLTEILSSFEGPRDWAEAYGSRIHGFLVPPTTGSYTFWIASDDYGQLWLSSDADPANAVQIADVPGWAGSREWNKYPADQQSDPIPLTAGTVYYIMALHKEGGGGDNLAVAWSGPGISQQVIDGAYLAPYAPGLNWGPTFDANPLTAYDALEGYVYPGSIAGSATAMDGGAVTYAKAAGPLWLAIGADGFMSGVPGDGDIGINRFTVAATDSHGQTGTATLEITVFDTFTGERGLTDFAAIAARWLEADCTDTPACGGADLSGDNNVTTEDLLAFADMWLIDKPYGKLITHWTFDTDALDEVSDHDGTFVNGAAINTADATIGAGCLALDGIDDYVEISGYKGITGTAARTCSAWIKTSSASENPVITWGSPNAGQKWMFRVNSNGTLSVGVWAGYIQTLQTVNNGQWHHVAAVLPDGAASVDQIRLYIDGILETAPYYNNTQAINTSDAADVTIGSRMDEGYSQACFDGLIDEVKIFNRALTASEIEQLVSFSLHLHLPLDESSGTTAADQSQFERPGQLLDNPVWQPTGGQVNGALQFDGVDDYVEITGYKGIVGTAARTCSAWVKTSDSTGWKDIIGWGKMETGQRWLLTVTPDGFLQLAAVGGYQRGSTAINDGQWHHVAAVFDNDGTPDVSDVRFYIDGVEETAYTVLPQTLNTVAGQDVSIGLFNDGYDRFFNGLIDDVRIYDRALNQHEIQAIMGQ